MSGRPATRRLGRREFVSLVAMMMALGALSVDLVLPAFDEIRDEFGLATDSTDTAAIITAFLLGLSLPQMVYGTLSDRFGRKPLLYAGFALFAVGAVMTAVATSMPALLAGRFVWGLGAAAPRVITLSIIRDTYEGERMARVMSFIFAVFIVVPIVAPTIGAGILAVAPWRWAFWFCVVFLFAVATWGFRLPETLDPANRIEINVGGVRRAIGIVLRSRQTIGYLITMTAFGGVFASYLASSELIWDEVYGLSDRFPYIFGGIAVVFGGAMLLNGFIVERVGLKRLVHSVQISYVVAGAGLLTIAIATAGRPNFWVFLFALALPLAHQALLIPNLNTLAMVPVGRVAGTASALIGTISTGIGALLGLAIDRSFNGTVTPLATAFVIAGLIGLVATWITERGDLELGRPSIETTLAVPPID